MWHYTYQCSLKYCWIVSLNIVNHSKHLSPSCVLIPFVGSRCGDVHFKLKIDGSPVFCKTIIILRSTWTSKTSLTSTWGALCSSTKHQMGLQWFLLTIWKQLWSPVIRQCRQYFWGTVSTNTSWFNSIK